MFCSVKPVAMNRHFDVNYIVWCADYPVETKNLSYQRWWNHIEHLSARGTQLMSHTSTTDTSAHRLPYLCTSEVLCEMRSFRAAKSSLEQIFHLQELCYLSTTFSL